MTDEITPASLRAHAEWMERNTYRTTASSLRDEADNLEAELNTKSYIAEVAEAQYNAEAAYVLEHGRGEISKWEDASQFQRDVTIAGVQAILDKLSSEGVLTDYATELLSLPPKPEPVEYATWDNVPHGDVVQDQDGDKVYKTPYGAGCYVNKSYKFTYEDMCKDDTLNPFVSVE